MYADTKGKWSGFEISTSRQNLAKMHGQLNNTFTGSTNDGPLIVGAITVLQSGTDTDFNMVREVPACIDVYDLLHFLFLLHTNSSIGNNAQASIGCMLNIVHGVDLNYSIS